MDIDLVKLNFNQSSLMILNVILGLIMFGIALDLKVSDFKRLFQAPKKAIVGLSTQLLLLPILTFGLVMLLQPRPSIALGMFMIAACPGGNISNFITHLSRGNTELSVTMTAICTTGAVFTTPFHLTFWGKLYEPSAKMLKSVQVDFWELFLVVFLLLGLPLVLGMATAAKFPGFAEKARKPFKIFSIVVFVLFIVLALAANFKYFLAYIGMVFVIVAIHNALAFSLGYSIARVTGLEQRDRRAITVEVGIQNTGLGLVLIFSFFNGLGGMAIMAAWWGIWHLFSGMILAASWNWWDAKKNAELTSAAAA